LDKNKLVMKVNRKALLRVLAQLRQSSPSSLSDQEVVARLADYMENHPSSIDLYGPSRQNRFSYATVGYGVQSLLGEKYRLGRIEVFDSQNESGHQTQEGTYCIPHQTAGAFQDFIENLKTPLPIHVSLGSLKWCKEECAKALKLSGPADLHEQRIIDQHRKKQLAALRRRISKKTAITKSQVN
jgi:hypothetical protein